MPTRLVLFRVLTVLAVVTCSFGLGFAAPSVAQGTVFSYCASYFYTGEFYPYGWTITNPDNILGGNDGNVATYYKPTYQGAIGIYCLFAEPIVAGGAVVIDVPSAGGGGLAIYALYDNQNLSVPCNNSCTVPYAADGVVIFWNPSGWYDVSLLVDYVSIEHEPNPTATSTPTGSPTATRTPGPTFASTCFPTFTPGNPTVTRTPTAFGMATATRNVTPMTRTPFPTIVFPPYGLGILEQFGSQSGALWHSEGLGIVWSAIGGRTSPPSIAVDLDYSRTATGTETLLVYPHSMSAAILSGWFFISDTQTSPNYSYFFSLQGWTGSGWELADYGGGNLVITLQAPEDINTWHQFRIPFAGSYSAMALSVNDTLSGISVATMYFDDLIFSTRGGQGGGCFAPVATPAPLSTLNPIPDCDANLCVGITHVPGTPPCIGYEAFGFEIPAVATYSVDGIQVCFERYELGEVRIGPYNFDWLIYIALYGIPILVGLWMVLRARA